MVDYVVLDLSVHHDQEQITRQVWARAGGNLAPDAAHEPLTESVSLSVRLSAHLLYRESQVRVFVESVVYIITEKS